MFDNWIVTHAEEIQIVLFFSLFTVFALVEVLAPKRPGGMHRKERWTTNLTLTGLNVVVLSLVPVTFFALAVWSQEKDIGLFNQFTPPLAL